MWVGSLASVLGGFRQQDPHPEAGASDVRAPTSCRTRLTSASAPDAFAIDDAIARIGRIDA
jgi:hypothetical protein